MRVLHEAPLDPRSRFVRLVLDEKRLPYAAREERGWERAEEFLALNPAGDAPVLREPDGLTIPGATVIAEHLEETSGAAPGLLGSDPAGRVETRRLVGWFLEKMSREVTEALREELFLKRAVRSEPPEAAVIRAAGSNLAYHLDYVGWLADHRRWLAGDELSLADLAAAAQLSVLDYLGAVPWERGREAKEWYARMKSRPSMRGVLAERVRGVPPPAAYADPDF